MSKAVTPPFEFSHEEHSNVVLQDLTRWDGETDGMDRVETEWTHHAQQPHITAAVTEFGEGISLGRETQAHIAREWSSKAEQVGIEKIAFVSEGIKARAVSANLDVPQEIQAFGSTAEAVEWAQA